MEDFLIATIMSTIIIVAIISHIVGRFHSLPIDIVGAAVAVDILFFDESHRAMKEAVIPFPGPQDGSAQSHAISAVISSWPMVALYALVFGFVLSAISVGIYVACQGRRRLAGLHETDIGSLFIEFGYAASLFFAMLFLYCAFSVNHAVPVLFSMKSGSELTLFDTARIVFGSGEKRAIMLTGLVILYAIFLFVRYFPSLAIFASHGWPRVVNLARSLVHKIGI